MTRKSGLLEASYRLIGIIFLLLLYFPVFAFTLLSLFIVPVCCLFLCFTPFKIAFSQLFTSTNMNENE